MRYGMCNLSVVAVRADASHKSEMVTQLLFGELFEIIEMNEDWISVKLIDDGYEGWIDAKQYLPLYNETFEKLNGNAPNVTLDIVQVITEEKRDIIIPIVLGSTLPFVINNSFYIENDKYSFDGNIRTFRDEVTNDIIIENALMYLDAPYLWGGRSPFGIDCSGFVQMAFKLSGIKLLRDANQQAAQGETVNFMNEATPGCLAFFDDEEGNITHVGIIMENNQIIHASGRVRIDSLDHEGIYNNQLKKYTHKLRLLKKII